MATTMAMTTMPKTRTKTTLTTMLVIPLLTLTRHLPLHQHRPRWRLTAPSRRVRHHQRRRSEYVYHKDSCMDTM